MYQEIFLLIVGALLGGGISLASAWWMWKTQIENENSNLAHGIYKDLDKTKTNLHLIVEANKHPQNIPNKSPLIPNQSFYPIYSLSPTVEDISRFDPALSKELFNYYYDLADAEKIRLELNDPNSILHKIPPIFDAAYTQMTEDLIRCYEKTSQLKSLISQKFPE